MGHSLFFSHDIIRVQLGGGWWALVGASVMWVCLLGRQTDREGEMHLTC